MLRIYCSFLKRLSFIVQHFFWYAFCSLISKLIFLRITLYTREEYCFVWLIPSLQPSPLELLTVPIEKFSQTDCRHLGESWSHLIRILKQDFVLLGEFVPLEYTSQTGYSSNRGLFTTWIVFSDSLFSTKVIKSSSSFSFSQNLMSTVNNAKMVESSSQNHVSESYFVVVCKNDIYSWVTLAALYSASFLSHCLSSCHDLYVHFVLLHQRLTI